VCNAYLVAEFLETQSPAGLPSTIMTAVSEWERQAIGERTRDTLSHKRAQRERVGNIGFGYRLAADGVHVELDTSEQAVITEIRELRSNGRSMRNIATDLNSQGLRTRRGSEWRLESVARVVNSTGPRCATSAPVLADHRTLNGRHPDI
jgi:site-specific DNA recombinase